MTCYFCVFTVIYMKWSQIFFRYSEHFRDILIEIKFEIFRIKKLGISGNIFRRFFVMFLSRCKRGYIWSLTQHFVRNFELSKRYIFWVNGQISIFFSILASLWWFLSETIIRYPIILKARFGGNFVRSFSRQKYQNLKNKKHTILGNSEFKIVANFQVNCVKTKKDEWKWAFLMSHMPTVLVKLFWTFGI